MRDILVWLPRLLVVAISLCKHLSPSAPDENTPKSKPKHEGDQSIRKRMIIAGSSYCDLSVIARLTVGTCFDLVAEPENFYDKSAVMLTLGGKKIGDIPKSDALPFITALKLKRKIYGVITDIRVSDRHTEFELEVRFERF